jgi:uncharacterized protein YjiS (DUF1127 family)
MVVCGKAFIGADSRVQETPHLLPRKLRIAGRRGLREKAADRGASPLSRSGETEMNRLLKHRSIIPAPAGQACAAVAAPARGGAAAFVGAGLRFVDGGLEHFVDKMFAWHRRLADRRALETLDDRMLHDIGLTRADVYLESRKPFWKP